MESTVSLQDIEAWATGCGNISMLRVMTIADDLMVFRLLSEEEVERVLDNDKRLKDKEALLIDRRSHRVG